DVDHLDLTTQPLVVQQRVHYNQRVAQNHPVHPLVLVLVSAENLIGNRMLRIAEQIKHVGLLVALVPLQCFQDCLGREPLVDEQWQRGTSNDSRSALPAPSSETVCSSP